MSCFFLYMCIPLPLPDWKISLCFSLSLTHARVHTHTHTHTHTQYAHTYSGTQITSLSVFVGFLSLCKNNQDDNWKRKNLKEIFFFLFSSLAASQQTKLCSSGACLTHLNYWHLADASPRNGGGRRWSRGVIEVIRLTMSQLSRCSCSGPFC